MDRNKETTGQRAEGHARQDHSARSGLTIAASTWPTVPSLRDQFRKASASTRCKRNTLRKLAVKGTRWRELQTLGRPYGEHLAWESPAAPAKVPPSRQGLGVSSSSQAGYAKVRCSK